ncbi:MAG TPA: arginase family protein [Methylomirabilota bacterium]|nr:arginase family protein [Methylomirabilota bacterium]
MADRFVSKFSLLHGTEIPVLRDGVPSFLAAPIARTPGDLAGADAAIIGIPYDRPATAGRGAGDWAGYREAPAHVRQRSLRYAGYLPELDLDVFERARLVDYGDAKIGPDLDRAVASVARKVQEVVEAGARPITIGGFSPCASYAVVKGLAAATAGRVGVLSLDAHGDCLDAEYGPGGSRAPGSATWQARMWDHCPNVDPRHHLEVGMRGPRNVRAQAHAYGERGGRLVTAAEVRRRGIEAICAEALPRVFEGTARTWCHLDMDVLDIGAVPDWGDEPLGLSAWDVVTAVHEAGRAGLDGLSFVYVAPRSPAIAAIVSYVVVYLLAGWILGGRLRPR